MTLPGVLIGLGLLIVIYHFAHAWWINPKKSPLEQRIEADMSQAFKDAFAAYQAAKESETLKRIEDAVNEALAGAHPSQEQLDAAKAEGAQAESDEDVATVQAAMPPAA